MSIDRVPHDAEAVLLTLYKAGNVCTIQAMWDKVEINRLESLGKCARLKSFWRCKVSMRRTRGSEPISRELGQEIAGRWITANYVKVQEALFDGVEQLEMLEV